MAHSVRRHLQLDVDEYDATIRRWIPGYETMLEQVAAAVAPLGPEAEVVDLGAGTGALAGAILGATDVASVEALDIDPEMLEVARARLAPFGTRATFTLASFDDPLPGSDAMVACIALHHVPTMEEKRALYARIRDALRSGGMLVNADCTMPSDRGARDALYRVWADHMIRHGIDEEQAYQNFRDWSAEDTYMPLEQELAALTDVGFEASCVWQEGPMSVIVARNV